VDKLEEHQASDIVMLDLREITPWPITSWSARRIRSDRPGTPADPPENSSKSTRTLPLSTEGEPASGWTLLDYNSVVVHVFSKQARAYYRLEELWKAAPVVLKIQ
jgi:ribosome-associated protein